MKILRLQKGFTLIELTIAIGIVGVLTTGVLVMMNPVKQFQRARDSQRKAAVSQIQHAAELYRADNDSYPTTASLSTCGASLTGANGTVYLRSIPCDPSSGSFYYVSETTSTYCARACLENTSDLQKDGTNNASITGCTTMSTCSSGVSYTVQNP